MRSITVALGALILATSSYAAPRHEPVVIVTPPRDALPLVSRESDGRPRVQTVTRDHGAVPFETNGTGVPEHGPARYGIDGREVDRLIAVRTREPLPLLLVSPWEKINGRTRDQIRRDFPYARRVDTITDDLRRAQRQYLRERGLILRVRTFSGASDGASSGVSKPTPRVLAPDEPVPASSTRVLPADAGGAQSPE